MPYDQIPTWTKNKIPNVNMPAQITHLEKMPPFSSERKEKKKTCIKLGSISYGIYTCLPLHSILNMNTRDLQSKANTFRLCFQHITPKSCGSVLVQVRIPNLFFFSPDADWFPCSACRCRRMRRPHLSSSQFM